MKPLVGKPFDDWRDRSPELAARMGGIGDETCGMFNLPGKLRVIASCGLGWDHLSVSHPLRCPTWEEMSMVKRTFFADDEWALEYHPPPSENISVHPFCLHLWRPRTVPFPVPPSKAVA